MRKLKIGAFAIVYAVLSPRFTLLLTCFVITAVSEASFAAEAEVVGLNALRRERPGITGAGVWVAQAEAQEAADAWQVNPAVNPAVAFRWIATGGTATNFPNSVGVGSSHAYGVADGFYGASIGVAPGIAGADSYDAGYFISDVVVPAAPIMAQVVNQSFVSGSPLNPIYDAYAVQYNVLFVSGMNNIADTPRSPGAAYNGIGVGILSETGLSSVGPTSDGRAKPDLVTPHFCCASFTTPRVAGAAALLLQAGKANDGGPGTAALATNASVVKALLLNGAVKTINWTNGFTRPLDARYGAGVLNVYNSDRQLRGGRYPALATNSVALGAAHPPTAGSGNIPSLRGWDFSAIQSSALNDRVAHYYFNLPSNAPAYSVTATLVWKKGSGALTNLNLFLYDAGSNLLKASSTSSVDNVEHIFVPSLSPGRYDLQVFKSGLQLGSETYALAFDFAPVTLTIARSGSNVHAAWPASAAGFALQGAAAVGGSGLSWQALNVPSFLSNGMNHVVFPATSAAQFVRLFRP